MSSWDEAKKASGIAQRNADLDLLRRLVDYPDVRLFEREAFAIMLRELEAIGSEGFFKLTDARRQWASDVAARVGCVGYENLVSSGRVPRGREVLTPKVLQNLPKKPPGRR